MPHWFENAKIAIVASSIGQRVEFLKLNGLFRDLGEPALVQIAGRFIDYKLDKGSLLYLKGERAANFYLVLSGYLQSQEKDEKEHSFESNYEPGDAFGSRALLDPKLGEASIKALEETQLLYMPRADFEWMLRYFSKVTRRLLHVSDGRRLKSEVEFEWLGEDETVFFVARKHLAYLWLRLSRSLVLAILAMLAFYFAIGAAAGSQFNWIASGGLLILGAIGWGIWEVLDWRNDYYILTNQRVVWLEQVLLRSSSRTEAPLANIQSVNTHTSFLGRLLGFGDLLVRTYTGSVVMPSVADPEHTKQLIEDYVARQRKESRDSKHDAIRQAVRESLGHPPLNGHVETGQRSLKLVDNTERWQLFKTRTVSGDIITYHKHWFTLASGMLLPTAFLLAVFFGLRGIYGGLPDSGFGWLLAFVFLSIPIAVMIYRVVDWQNDIYLITPDTLMDKERKPLGSEVTKSASLANVLSLENHKVGIIGLLLNFGVVRANVGDATLDFDDVHNPAQVQQDIFARMEALKVKQEKAKADDERTRMTEWLRVYEEERGRSGPPPAQDTKR